MKQREVAGQGTLVGIWNGKVFGQDVGLQNIDEGNERDADERRIEKRNAVKPADVGCQPNRPEFLARRIRLHARSLRLRALRPNNQEQRRLP